MRPRDRRRFRILTLRGGSGLFRGVLFGLARLPDVACLARPPGGGPAGPLGRSARLGFRTRIATRLATGLAVRLGTRLAADRGVFGASVLGRCCLGPGLSRPAAATGTRRLGRLFLRGLGGCLGRRLRGRVLRDNDL
jgi:hypothetical protein